MLSTDMLLQYIAIAVVLGVCIVWIYRKLRKKGNGVGDGSSAGCDGCILSQSCGKKSEPSQKNL